MAVQQEPILNEPIIPEIVPDTTTPTSGTTPFPSMNAPESESAVNAGPDYSQGIPSASTSSMSLPPIGEIISGETAAAEGVPAEEAAVPTQAEIDAPYADPNQTSPLAWENLNKMLAEGSPIIERARTKGTQFANSQGLLNSSIAAGAAENAAIDAVQPFALQDAAFGAQLLADRQNAALQNDTNAPSWLLDVYSSDMDSNMKQFLLDTVYPNGLPGVDYSNTTGEVDGNGAPKLPEFKWDDYKAVQNKYDGSFTKFIGDSEGREQWRTGKGQGYKNVLKTMGGDYTKTSINGDYIFRNLGESITNRYGSYDNAKRAALLWLGPGKFSKAEIEEVILAGLK